MNLTEGQNKALEAIDRLNKANPSGGGVLVVNGYAGVGKTTLIRTIGDDVGNMLVLAPTGKAALRVRDVAFVRTSTIHRWLYTPDEDETTGEVFFRKKGLLEIDHPGHECLIIDEASMINKEVWDDIKDTATQLGLNIVLVGDEFQLPPVETTGNDYFSVFGPDFAYDERVNLTEVLRQGLENPIIKAATALRTGNNYTTELTNIPMVVANKLIDESVNTWSNDGVVIVHKNETRHKLNSEIRTALKRVVTIEEKEPILVTKNNYNLDIFNGEIFTIKRIIGSVGSKTVKDRYQHKSCYMDFLRVELQNGDDCIITHEELNNKADGVGFKFINSISKQLTKNIAKNEKLKYPFIPHIHANYGYSLTCHKAQGSEWKDVLIVAESSIGVASYAGRRWLYTALTRAKENAKICWY